MALLSYSVSVQHKAGPARQVATPPCSVTSPFQANYCAGDGVFVARGRRVFVG
jgi:hypothetical protein